MASQSEENYLKALLLHANESDEVNLSEISNALAVSTPSANSMVKKLHEKGLVKYEKYKPLVITAKGKKAAGLIIRKHRLTEMFLVEKMGFGWEEVHDIAEQVEHINSPAFFERMDELLDHPSIDPHGSPIPNKNGDIVWKAYEKLNECVEGQEVYLSALTHSSSSFLKYLNRKELSLGIKLKVVSIEPFDNSMILAYDNHPNETFSQEVCERLLVQKVN